jgi:trimeric autotransporter adhesin
MRALRNGYRLTALVSLTAASLWGCSNNNGIGFGNSSAGGDTFALTSSNRLITFNQASPSVRSAVTITGLQSNEQVLGIDVRPKDGAVYALGSSGRVYILNPATGAATATSTLTADATDTTNPFTALSGTDYGVDFNPVVDRLRVISDTGMNLRINVDTGATITDGTLNSTGVPTRTGVTGAAYTNSFNAACRTTLFFVDSSNNRLLVTNDPNNGVVTEVGALGITGGTVNGFEILTGGNGANQALVALTVGSAVQLYSVSTMNGLATPLGTITGLNANEVVRGLAVSPPGTAPAQAMGNVVGITETSKLISFNNASPQKLCTTAAITGLNAGETILGADLRPADGLLYAVSSAARVLTINTQTAAATAVSTLTADANDTTAPFTTLNGTEFGVDFNPTVDRLRIVSDANQNLRVNVDTGATITDTDLNGTPAAVRAAAYTNSFQGAGTTTLYVLDTANDQLLIQGQPSGNPNNGDLQVVGALGADSGPISSFEINAINNTALAALNVGGATTSDLYTLNLASGAATRVNTIGGGERVRSIAYSMNPTTTLTGLTDDGRLATFQLATIGTFDNAPAVTGLQGGESLVGIDYRPANGKLYGVSDAGNLYTLDPMSGAATLVAALTADPMDQSNPFTALPAGAVFGVDFNPMADRLRVVSSGGVNLRINADTGLTTTDTNLTPATSTVVASAYTQNYATPGATSLFGLDSTAGNLVLQSPPNDGTLINPLSLGLTFTGTGGFDIVGGGDGLVLAALQTAAGAQSGLYRVSLTTGLATPVATNPAIGPANTVLRGFAIRLQ